MADVSVVNPKESLRDKLPSIDSVVADYAERGEEVFRYQGDWKPEKESIVPDNKGGGDVESDKPDK